MSSAGRRTITTGSPPAVSSAICWNAARKPPAAPSPIGTRCPTGTTSAIPSRVARRTAASSSPKPKGTGGLVAPAVIAEQTLYEIGDPAAYVLPDVIADFSRVRLTQIGENEVLVEGARGRAPTPSYKVSATYQDGFRAVASVSIVGPRARKGREDRRGADRAGAHELRTPRPS